MRGQPNAVRSFFEASLVRTGDRRHARLNTQRKVLSTLASLWRHKAVFSAEKFLAGALPPGKGAATPTKDA